MIVRGLLCLFLVLGVMGCSTSVPEGVKPVDGFTLNQYLGKWYEVARLNHSFEEGLSHVTATYSLREDGGVKVINRGYSEENDEWEEAEGKAYFVSDEQTGHLKVSFFGPFYASYVVAELDKKDYQYALITGPDTDYLWVLSRTPTLPNDILNALVNKASALGFDTQQLIYVDQTPMKTAALLP